MRNMTYSPSKTRYGQIASAIGLLGLLSAFIGFVWQGDISPAIIGFFVVGIAGIAAWVAITPQEAIGLLTGRQVRHGTLSIIATLLLVGIVALVYVALQRAVITLDMTQSEQFSLTRQSFDVLKRVNQPLQITGFYSSVMLPQREVDDQFFRLYETATDGLIRRVYIDPNEQPAIAQAFGMREDGDVFVSFLDENGNPDLSRYIYVTRGRGHERDMTEAIARLLISGEFTIFFDISYSSINPDDTGQQGITRVLNGLTLNGFNAGIMNLKEMEANGVEVPPEANAIVLTRMVEELSPGAIAILDRYLERGGALFVMADATFNENAFLAEDSPFNQYLWDNFGLKMLDAVIVDEMVSGPSALDVVSVVLSDGSSITDGLNDPNDASTQAQFRIARPVQIDTTPPVTNGMVIQTSMGSFGETDIETLSTTNNYSFSREDDFVGPMNVAAWAHNQTTGARVILIGDSDFITNGQVVTPMGNSILFLDGVAWLTDYAEDVNFSFQPRITDVPLIFVSPQQLDMIAFFTVVFMPGVVLATGLFIWRRRNRR